MESNKKLEKPILLSIIAVLVIVIVAMVLRFCSNESSISVIKENNATAGNLSIGLKHNYVEGTEFLLLSPIQPGDIITIGEFGLPGMTKIEIFNKGNTNLLFISNFIIKGDEELANALYFKDLTISLYSDNGENRILQELLIDDGDIINQDLVNLDGCIDGKKDGKISLAEWLNYENKLNGIPKGWEVVGLPRDGVYEIAFTLKFDKAAGKEYQGKSLDIGYNIYASHFSEESLIKLMNDNNIPSPKNSKELFNNRVKGYVELLN